MNAHRHAPTCTAGFLCFLTIAGCASSNPRSAGITGEHAAHFSGVWTSVDSQHRAPVVPIEHTFTLHNEAREPVTITAHRTRIDTVWRFTDTNDGRLPRTIAPGQTIEVAMRGTMRKPGPHRFFADLMLDSGRTVTLELVVDS